MHQEAVRDDLCEQLEGEDPKTKIRFLCVSPAAVATDFVQGRDRGALEKLAEKTPLNKVVEPDDVALAILGCITHLKTATGTRIIIDGGKNL